MKSTKIILKNKNKKKKIILAKKQKKNERKGKYMWGMEKK
jgi:hypothetical protein